MSITALDVAKKALELAEASPDTIYKTDSSGICRYVHRDSEGQPIPGEGCLFGQALAALGVAVPTSCEGSNINAVIRELIDRAHFSWGRLGQHMATAQSEQDAREPWSVSARYLRLAIASQEQEVAA